jgi:hypothetical protein
MSLSVSLRRSARAELIEAAARYESERQDLGVEFIAEIERCFAAAAERPIFAASLPSDSRLACTSARKHTVSSFWPFSMAAGTPRFGSTGLSERRR